MKNVIILISFLFFAFTVEAQDVNKSFSTNASNVTYVGVAADTVLNSEVWYMRFNLSSKNKRQGYHLQVAIDSISGDASNTVILSGSDDGGTTKTTITTLTCTTILTDTLLYFSDVATGVLWRDMYITVTGTATGKQKVTSVYGKIGDL